jgi:hypothetical protein
LGRCLLPKEVIDPEDIHRHTPEASPCIVLVMECDIIDEQTEKEEVQPTRIEEASRKENGDPVR